MDEVIKLVRTYRFTAGLAQRSHLAEQIFRIIAPDLRLFVFSRVSITHAEDVFQEVLKAVATNLKRFEGDTTKNFWSWCYSIARNKLSDQYRKQANDKTISVSPDDLREMIERSAQNEPITPAVQHDLDYAMKLLTNSKPECFDFLWNHFIFGLDYADIAEEKQITYDAARMRVGRCLDEVKSLIH